MAAIRSEELSGGLGRALAVSRNDERAAAVAVCKVVVERGCDILVGKTDKRVVKAAGLLDDFPAYRKPDWR